SRDPLAKSYQSRSHRYIEHRLTIPVTAITCAASQRWSGKLLRLALLFARAHKESLMSLRTSRSRFAVVAVATLAVSLTLASCQKEATTSSSAAGDGPGSGGSSPTQTAAAPKATLKVNVAKGAEGVAVDTAVSVHAKDGTVDAVVFHPK